MAIPGLQIPQMGAVSGGLDFTPLANLGQVYQQAQQQRQAQQDADNRRMVLSQLGQGGKVDPSTLLNSGDLQLAQLGINIQNRQDDQSRQATADARNESHWQADHALRVKEANRRAENSLTEEEKVNNRIKILQARGIDPNSPEGRTFALTGTFEDPNKPRYVAPGGALVDNSGKVVYGNGTAQPAPTAPVAGAAQPQADAKPALINGYSAALINNLADRAHGGDSSWKTGLAREKGLIKTVEEEVARRNEAAKAADPNANPTAELLQNRANQYGRNREMGTLGTATANNVLYGNAAAATMQTALEASDAVPRTTWVPVNKLLQLGERNISDPKLKALTVATNTLINDYAKATTPVGTPTDSQREHAREMLSTVDSPEAYAAAVKMMHREIVNTHRAIEETKKALQSGKAPEPAPIAERPKSGGAQKNMTSKGVPWSIE